MMNGLKLCTFDVTNTLLKFRIPVGEQYAKIGRIYGVDRQPHQITKSFLQNWKLMNTNHPNYGRTTEVLTSNGWWRELVRRAFATDSEELTNRQLDSISEHLYDLYKGEECWRVVPNAKSVLFHLKKKKLTLGVISNFDERLLSVLESNGLGDFFDFVLGSYDAKVEKPDKQIFELALGKVNNVKPTEALHVGDNISLDYFAAKNAGWNALLLQHDEVDDELFRVDPTEIIFDLGQVRHFVL